jgi:hypothetical protein
VGTADRSGRRVQKSRRSATIPGRSATVPGRRGPSPTCLDAASRRSAASRVPTTGEQSPSSPLKSAVTGREIVVRCSCPRPQRVFPDRTQRSTERRRSGTYEPPSDRQRNEGTKVGHGKPRSQLGGGDASRGRFLRVASGKVRRCSDESPPAAWRRPTRSSMGAIPQC